MSTSIILVVLGVALTAVVLWDVLITVFSARGAGFLTRLWTEPAWAVLLRIHRRRRIHPILTLTGPVMLFASILIWYGLLGIGAYLVFAAAPDSVVLSSDRTPSDKVQNIYFVGATLSSLGYGDLVPSGFPWTLAASLTPLFGTIVLTSSLSYILSVLVPAVQRKTFASGVRALGDSPAQIVRTAQLHDQLASLKSYVSTLCTQMTDIAAKHLAFPVLRHFHAAQVQASPARAVLLLSDACFLMTHQPSASAAPPNVLTLLQASIDDYADMKGGRDGSAPDRDEQHRYLRVEAESLGMDISPSYLRAQDDYLDRRQDLLAMCDADGWPLG